MPGVIKVLTAADIPGDGDMGTPYFGGRGMEPEPLLVKEKGLIHYAGEPVAIVVAGGPTSFIHA